MTLFEVPFVPEADRLPDELQAVIPQFDQSIFLARLGDQLRFTDVGQDHCMVVSYALSKAMIASPFAKAEYDGFAALAKLIDQTIAGAAEIKISCARGTAVFGTPSPAQSIEGEVNVRRFPKLIFTPVLGETFSGRVAMPGFMTGTGSRYYDPFTVEFDGPLHAKIDNGMLTDFEGAPGDVGRANRHVDMVAEKFGLDRNCIHSWHAGIHPACAYDRPAHENYQRWSGAAFGNPRILHFHTCGAEPPGEISWNVIDPTVVIDGETIWENGVLHIERLQGARAILNRYPGVKSAFANPQRAIGLPV